MRQGDLSDSERGLFGFGCCRAQGAAWERDRFGHFSYHDCHRLFAHGKREFASVSVAGRAVKDGSWVYEVTECTLELAPP